MLTKDKPITIVGQGIAGSVLAYLLLQRGFQVHVIDDDKQNSSSRVAAGMWNPVVFTGLKLSWNATVLLPKAEAFYRNMEQELNASFYHPLELVRVFPDTHSANEWDTVDEQKALASFLYNERDELVEKSLNLRYGYGIVKNTGWLHVSRMLHAMREFLISKQAYSNKHLDTKDLLALKGDVILCNGIALKEHPWFQWIKLIPNKGQVLLIHAPGLILDRMVHFGRFLIPLGNDYFRLGGIYEYEHPIEEPTEEIKHQLLQELSEVYSGPLRVMEHLAGYRPTTLDRRPLIGSHPDHPNRWVFNGLGSRGVLLAPYCAELFYDHAINGVSLSKELSIARFLKYRTA